MRNMYFEKLILKIKINKKIDIIYKNIANLLNYNNIS